MIIIVWCIITLVQCDGPPHYLVTEKIASYEYLRGLYCKTDKYRYYSGMRYEIYREEHGRMYLLLNNAGYWEFTRELNGNVVETQTPFSNSYPGDLVWDTVNIRASWLNKDFKNRCLKAGGIQNRIFNDEEKRASKEKEITKTNSSDKQDAVRCKDLLQAVICLSVILVIVLCVVVVVFIYSRVAEAKSEEPEVEKNPAYGLEDDYYNEHDNRLEDRNEYYQCH